MMTPAPRAAHDVGLRRRRGVPTAPDQAAAGPSDVLTRLTDFIPTEAVALYVAILAFLVPKDVALEAQDFTSRWVLAIGVAVAAVLFGVGIYRRAVLDRGGTFRWPFRRTVTVVLAYGAWVFAIPASPLNSFGWYTGSIGAVVGIAVSAVIALIHLWFGPPEN
jgi:hypothetical protein